MKHLVSSLILAGVLMVPGPSAEARSHWPGPLGGHHGKFWKRGDVRRRLELTEDQVRSLEQIFARNEQMLADLEADVKKKKADFDALLADDRDDDKRIMAEVDLLEQALAEEIKDRDRALEYYLQSRKPAPAAIGALVLEIQARRTEMQRILEALPALDDMGEADEACRPGAVLPR